MVFSEENFQKLKRGITEIISEEELKGRLESSRKTKKPLRIKAGFDPTAPDIHLGHTVLLQKLRQFQDLGQIVFFLIGDFTAQIGDPSGQDQKRPKINKKEIKQNTKTYSRQAFKILDPKRTKVVFNSSWLSKIKIENLLKLTSYATVAQLLARADFKQRFEQQKEISVLEFIYPLLQAYDSVYLNADIEFGGTDQKFNLLMGRQLQGVFNKRPQTILMMPLLEGTDGMQKMSKSLNNYIGINEPPRDIFGKLMSISDDLMWRYYELLTNVNIEKTKLLHPKDAKLNLAEIIVKQYYGKAKAKDEKTEFERTFSKKDLPENIPIYRIKMQEKPTIVKTLMDCGFAKSGNEVRRLIQQGAISINGKKITQENTTIEEGVLKAGKHKFIKIIKK